MWIFWHVVLGSILIKVNKTWEAPLMATFCLVQAFLASMIIGVVIPGLDLKIGSSPFILLKDYMGDLPVYKINPNKQELDGEVMLDKNVDGRIFYNCVFYISDHTIVIENNNEIEGVFSLHHFYLLKN